tara:strand:+ start:134 stop:367 length:234 start_codon:yes stop_codon:yes gene_type:complete
VGDIVEYICVYSGQRDIGYVRRILEEVEGLRPQLFLLESQEFMGQKQWKRESLIISKSSPVWSIAEDLSINQVISEG